MKRISGLGTTIFFLMFLKGAVLAAAESGGQETLQLSRAINEALERNPEIQAAKRKVESVQARAKQATYMDLFMRSRLMSFLIVFSVLFASVAYACAGLNSMPVSSMSSVMDNEAVEAGPCSDDKQDACESLRYRMISIERSSAQTEISPISTALPCAVLTESSPLPDMFLATLLARTVSDSISQISPYLSRVILRIYIPLFAFPTLNGITAERDAQPYCSNYTYGFCREPMKTQPVVPIFILSLLFSLVAHVEKQAGKIEVLAELERMKTCFWRF